MEAGAAIDPRGRRRYHRQAASGLECTPEAGKPASTHQPSSTVPWGLPTALVVLAVTFVAANVLALLIGALLTIAFDSAFDRHFPSGWTMIALQVQAIAVGLAITWLVLIGLECDH